MDIADMDDFEDNSSKSAFINSADMKSSSNILLEKLQEKRKPGRPKKSIDEKATEQVFVNITKDEKLRIEKYAKSMGISTSALVKVALSKFGAL